jgi:2-alkenal reductase
MKLTWLSKVMTVLVLLAVLGLVACSPSGLVAVVSPVASPTPAAAQVVPVVAVVATPAPAAATSAQGTLLLAQEQLLADLYERVKSSVVNITVSMGSGEATGSGFVYDEQGHIVTNNHVVENATKIWVTFSDGNMVQAKVVGTDPGSDLAVIQVDVSATKLTSVTLGDSESLRVGQLAVAIGNPFGLEGTMTVGIISALGRVMPAGSSSFAIVDLIQTDAPINPGNSGGPLLDSAGRVVGVNTLIFTQSGTSSGVGLAVPVAAVKRVVPVLISQGHYAHAWLGISGRAITPALADEFNLPVQQGVLVDSVTAGGPAERAGIRGGTRSSQRFVQTPSADGDIIVAVNDVEVKSFDDLVGYLARNTEVGQKLTLTVLRGGQRQPIEVTLTERPAAV